jgi:hypothetical protein
VLLEVVSELNDRVESVGSLDVFIVVGNDDGLTGLEGDNALFALLCLEPILACLDGHVLYAVDLDTLGDDLLWFRLVVEGLGDGCPLLIGQREARGCGPVGCAVDIADEGLVDVAAADEAGVNVCLPGHVW